MWCSSSTNDRRAKRGSTREDEQLGLPDDRLQVLIHQKNLVVWLGCRYFKELVEPVKKGLFHPLHKLTPSVFVCTTQTKTLVWNQGLVNLDFDYNKTTFRTNDYISNMIRQDDFQSGNHKDKSSQGEIMKKKTTSKRSVFQYPSFIRSLCKIVGTLGFPCITFFTYALK